MKTGPKPKLSAGQLEIVIARRARRESFGAIATDLGRRTETVRRAYLRAMAERGETPVERPRGQWTQAHETRLRQLSRAGRTYREIADELGFSHTAVHMRLRILQGRDGRAPRASAMQAPLAVRPEPATLTGRLLGDPPPGRSALDRLRANGPICEEAVLSGYPDPLYDADRLAALGLADHDRRQAR